MTIERTRESVKDFYERRYAAAYMSGHRPLEVKRVRDVLSLIPQQAIRSVLDYGCGRGVWVPVLSEIFPGAGIAGTDISEAAVASAQAAFPDVTFVVSDGSCAPWPDESFDLVFCYHVVEHVLDLDALVADLSRLVKAGGWVCAITPCANEGSLERRMTEIVGGVQRSITGELRFAYEDSGHLRRLTTAEAVAAFGRGSLRLEEARFANHWWGTLEYMARSDAGSVRRFLGGRRARTKASHDSPRTRTAQHKKSTKLACDVLQASPRMIGNPRLGFQPLRLTSRIEPNALSECRS